MLVGRRQKITNNGSVRKAKKRPHSILILTGGRGDLALQPPLCFAKILCALKIARFPAATAVPSRLFLHPSSANNLSRRSARALYLYIYKDGGTRTFSRRYVGSD